MNTTGNQSAPVQLSNNTHNFNPQEQNNLIKKWVPKVRRNLKSNAKKFVNGKTESFVTKGNRVEGKLKDSIKGRTGMEDGVIEFASFSFERHGVFVHKGVSKGHGVLNPRHKEEWFNPALDKHLPELADKLAEINTDASINATRLQII